MTLLTPSATRNVCGKSEKYSINYKANGQTQSTEYSKKEIIIRQALEETRESTP